MGKNDVAAFLDAVIPPGVRYIGYPGAKKNKSGRPVMNCSAFDTANAGISTSRSHFIANGDVYFALASYKVARVPSTNGDYMKSHRVQSNVDKLKAVWLDVDFKSYDSPEDCAAGVREFIGGFLLPTYVVNSGGGVHLYWVLEEAITPEQWLPMAHGLAGLAREGGLRADFGVTTDSARVLRLPGTHNQKYENKPECRITGVGSFTSIAALEPLLLPYAAKSKTLPSAEIIPMDSNVYAMFPTSGDDLTGGYDARRKSTFANIATGCGTVAASLANGGASDGYILWKDLLHLAAYTEDGEGYVEPLSGGHAGYDPADATMRYDESVAARAAGRVGPTSCERFALHSDACAACVHKGKIASPWVLGLPQERSPGPTFVKGNATYTMREEEDEAGDKVMVQKFICVGTFEEWKLAPLAMDDGGSVTRKFVMSVRYRNGKTDEILVIPPVLLADISAFRATVFDACMTWNDYTIKLLREVSMAWVTRLRQEHESGDKAKVFGWTAKNKSFIWGNNELFANTTAPVSAPNMLADEYRSEGDPEIWNKLARIMVNDSNPEFSFLIAAGFAAPLMALGAPVSAALSAYSRKSGTGKTSILKLIAGAFGSPRKMFAMDDTSNFFLKKAGLIAGMPALWDEVRGQGVAQSMAETIFRMTQGRTKGRLNAAAELQETHDLDVMLICGTNTPIRDLMNSHVQQTDAGLMRIMEMDMDINPDDNQDVHGLIGKLGTNYGHSGPEFIKFVLSNMATMEALADRIRADLHKEANFARGERFWQDAMGKIIMAAVILKWSGILDIDPGRVKRYALVLLKQLRANVEESYAEDRETLSAIVAFYSDNLLVTDHFHCAEFKNVRVLRAPRGYKLDVHIAARSKVLRLTTTTLKDYAIARKLSLTNLRATIAESNSMSISRFSLGAGTNYGQGQSRGYEIQLDNTVGNGIIAAWPEQAPSSQNATPGSSSDPQP